MKYIIGFLLCVMALQPIMAKDITIVSTNKPVHGLVEYLLDGVTKNHILLFEHGVHNVKLKPSDVANIKWADMVVLLSPEFETYMKRYAGTDKAIILKNSPNLKILPSRVGIPFESLPKYPDYHVWLGLNEMLAMADYLQEVFSQKMPDYAQKINENHGKFVKKLHEWHNAIPQNITLVEYHDSLQYLTLGKSINIVGSLTTDPDTKPSVKRMRKVGKLMVDDNIHCIIADPEVSDKIFSKIPFASVVEVDLEGITRPAGKEFYDGLFADLAKQLAQCR